MSEPVITKPNVLGIDLRKDQVGAVLKNEDEESDFGHKRRWLSSFFQLDDLSELTRDMLNRYAEVDEKMARITFGSNDEGIYARLIGTLASAKRCYSYAEYLACIELCALHGEMLANYLCITEKEDLETIFTDLSIKLQKSITNKKGVDACYSDEIRQGDRLKWLEKAKILSADDKKALLFVHELRKKYFHHWSPKAESEKQDAIEALSMVSPATAKFLEIFDSSPSANNINTANLERVKRYMKMVSE